MGARVNTEGRIARMFLRMYAAAVCLFLLAPLIITVVLSFSAGDTLAFPPKAFSGRWFAEALRNTSFTDGFRVSLLIAAGVALISAVAGTAAAVALNHYRVTYSGPVRAFVMLPLALPGIVLGLGILFVLRDYGMAPGLWATMLGHSVIGIPYVTYMVLASFSNYDMALEQASLNLGESRAGTFFRITLPLIAPGIVGGAAVAFIMSFDNFSLSLFITKSDTLPLRLMQHVQGYLDPAVAAVATMLVALSLVVAFALSRLARGGTQLRIGA
jgi:putative spermidine/putrescine transport system permease protein